MCECKKWRNFSSSQFLNMRPQYQFVNGISKEEWSALINSLDHPFTNKHLLNGLYPLGSIIKMGVGMAMLNTGIISPSTLIESRNDGLAVDYFVTGKRGAWHD